MADPGGGGGIVHVTGQVASDVVGGLKNTPGMLLVVLLNSLFCAGATYFLLKQEGYRHDERLALGQMLDKCIDARGVRP